MDLTVVIVIEIFIKCNHRGSTFQDGFLLFARLFYLFAVAAAHDERSQLFGIRYLSVPHLCFLVSFSFFLSLSYIFIQCIFLQLSNMWVQKMSARPIVSRCVLILRMSKLSSARYSTINAEEVKKFSNLNVNHWWQSSEYAPLRSLNQLRVPLVVDSLVGEKTKEKTSQPLQSLKLLDVGCGGGILSEPLARLGGQVTGLDAVSTNIDAANQHMLQDKSLSSLSYICNDIETLAKDANHRGQYDAIVASEVLEHVNDVKLFLSSASDLLVPNGRLIITTINQTLAARVLAITVAESILHLLPEGTHSYDKFVPVTGLKLLLNKLHFSVSSVQGMLYNPISGNWSWVPSTAINYALVAIKQESQKEAK